VKFVLFLDHDKVAGVHRHHAVTAVCLDDSMMMQQLVAATTSAAEDHRLAAARHICVQPVAVNSRPIMLVSHHQTMPQAAAAAEPVFVIQYQQPPPLNANCLATLYSTAWTGQSNLLPTRHKTKRRRKNKVRYKLFFL